MRIIDLGGLIFGLLGLGLGIYVAIELTEYIDRIEAFAREFARFEENIQSQLDTMRRRFFRRE